MHKRAELSLHCTYELMYSKLTLRSRGHRKPPQWLVNQQKQQQSGSIHAYRTQLASLDKEGRNWPVKNQQNNSL
jgi:hypothetical protein